tara:strand:- start:183 stop:818 length:636 start_codon:yes stop_codon:yes gene_type:complete
MGYLDGSSITVDAILTEVGKRKLANGQGLGIKKFALSDDGVDYTLYNTGHASGSDSYGEAITSLPNLEAVPDNSIVMRYHLMTMDRDKVYLPLLQINPTSVSISRQGKEGEQIVTVNTLNWGHETYSWKVLDSSALSISAASKNIGSSDKDFHHLQGIPQQKVYGPSTSLTIHAKPVDETITTTVEVYGERSGAIGYFTVTLNRNIRKLVS